MPVVLRKKGYRFLFYASDGDEPPHIHAKKSGKTAKYWLTPIVTLEKNNRFRPHELKEVEKIVEEYRDYSLEKWNAFFGN